MFKFCNMLGTLVSEIPFTRCLKTHSSAVARIEGTPHVHNFSHARKTTTVLLHAVLVT